MDQRLAQMYSDQGGDPQAREGSIFQEQTVGGWRAATGEPFPTTNIGELVVFDAFYRCGFGIPVHPFLHGLVDYYQIALCNLNPNSMLYIAIFINLCEAYLGIEPHFNLFQYFF